MELKVLSLQDRDRITLLFLDVFTHEPWNDDWSDEKQLNAYIADLTGQSNSLTLGYFDGGSLAALSMGHIKHWYTGTEYYIDEFCVDRRRQGQGVGTAFLQAMAPFLLERGVCQIFLQTGKDVPAYAFYVRNGFHELEGHVSFAKRIDA